MSYCRFSCLDFGCDVYAYEDSAGGYTIHLAHNRVVGTIPTVPGLGAVSTQAYLTAHNAQLDFVTAAPRERLTLPHAGETLHERSLEDLLDRLQALRTLGYRFPDHVLDVIESEIEDAEEGADACD